MRVDEIMSRTVITLPPDATVGAAIELIVQRQIHHLLVVSGTKIDGAVSARELSGKDSSTPLAKVMNGNIRTVAPSATLREAARLMVGNSAGCIPIVEGNRIVGILTTSDLMKVLTAQARQPVITRHGTV